MQKLSQNLEYPLIWTSLCLPETQSLSNTQSFKRKFMLPSRKEFSRFPSHQLFEAIKAKIIMSLEINAKNGSEFGILSND